MENLITLPSSEGIYWGSMPMIVYCRVPVQLKWRYGMLAQLKIALTLTVAHKYGH